MNQLACRRQHHQRSRPKLGNLHGTAILALSTSRRNQAPTGRERQAPPGIRSPSCARRPLSARRPQPDNRNGTCWLLCGASYPIDSLLLDGLDPSRRVECLSAGSVARAARIWPRARRA